MKGRRVLHWFPLGFLILLASVAVACGSSATSTIVPTAAPAPTTAPTPRATATPTTAPTVARAAPKLSVATDPAQQEENIPWLSDTSATNFQIRGIREALIDLDNATGELIPGLATSWEASADAKTWTFKLRRNIPFHDNWGTFTAEDVVPSFANVNREDSIVKNDFQRMRRIFGPDEVAVRNAIQIVDDYTVVFNMIAPDVDFDDVALSRQGATLIYPAAQWEKEGAEGLSKTVIGTGPWKYAGRVLGSSISYTRVENHWRRVPEFSELKINFSKEPATRLAQLLTGEVQMATLPSSLYAQAQGRGMKVISSTLPGKGGFYLFGGQWDARDPLHDPKEPFLNVKVREAVNRAINRKEIHANLFGGRVQPWLSYPFHPAWPGYNPQWEKDFDRVYGYDPAKAKALLAEAGYSNGLKVKITMSAHQLLPQMGELGDALALYLKAVGIDVEQVEIEWANLLKNLRGQKTNGTILVVPTSFRSSVVVVGAAMMPKSSAIVTDPRIDERYNKVTNSVDPVERQRLMQEIGDLSFYEYWAAPVAYLANEIVIDPAKVKEWVFPAGNTGGFTHWEYAVPAQ